MESKLQKALQLKYPPIAIIWSDTKPPKAMQFKESKWGCIMFLYNNALRGNISVVDENTYGCFRWWCRFRFWQPVHQFS